MAIKCIFSSFRVEKALLNLQSEHVKKHAKRISGK